MVLVRPVPSTRTEVNNVNAHQFALGVATILDTYSESAGCKKMANRRRKSLNRLIDRELVYRALAHTVAECSPRVINQLMSGNLSESVRQTAGILLNIASSRGFPICPDKRERRAVVGRSVQEIFSYFTRILAGGPKAASLELAAACAADMNQQAAAEDKVTAEQIQATSRWGSFMLEPQNIRTVERFLADLPEDQRGPCLREACSRITRSNRVPAQQELLDILQISAQPNSVN